MRMLAQNASLQAERTDSRKPSSTTKPPSSQTYRAVRSRAMAVQSAAVAHQGRVFRRESIFRCKATSPPGESSSPRKYLKIVPHLADVENQLSAPTYACKRRRGVDSLRGTK